MLLCKAEDPAVASATAIDDNEAEEHNRQAKAVIFNDRGNPTGCVPEGRMHGEEKKKMGRERQPVSRAVCIYGIKVLFMLCIAFVAFESYMHRADGIVDTLPLLLVIFVTLGCLALSKYFAGRFQYVVEKYFTLFFIFYLLCTFILQIILGKQVRYTPMWDLGSVFHGAVSWAGKGNIDDFAEYFYYFPNNLGLTVLFRGYFTIVHTVLGEKTDYFMAALVLGSAVVTVFRFSVIQISRKLFGEEYAVTAAVLLLLCFPLYFAAAVFYTDVMSMAAPALFYLLYLYAKRAESLMKSIVWYVMMSFVAAVGMEIKFTVVIIAIAVGIELLLRGEWKRFALMAGVHLTVICAVFSAVDFIVYSGPLVREQAEKQNTPYLHWIMMGAQGNGSYCPEDYEFTRSFENREEQQKALKAEIKRRYREMGIQGTLNLWKNKTIKCFGDGTYALSDFLDDEPAETSKWNQWILYSGNKYDRYQTLCLGVFVTVMLLMLFGVIGSFGRRRVLSAEMTALWLAFLGLWIFLMLWETSARYFTNYLSVMLVAAVFGLPYFEISLKRAVCAVRRSWRRERSRQ